MYNGWVILECCKKLLGNVYFGTVEPNLKSVRRSSLYLGSALVSNLVQVKTTEKGKNTVSN